MQVEGNRVAVWCGSLVLLLTASTARGQSVEGTWRNPTGSVMSVYPCAGAVCLKILQVEKSAPGALDRNNPDPKLQTRSLCGLQIGSGFHLQEGGAKAEDGQLYDPKSGKTYSGSIATDGADKLKLRGYVGLKMFGRSEEWTRVAGEVSGCRGS